DHRRRRRGDKRRAAQHCRRRQPRALRQAPRMSRKRIIVTGYMARCPIAGVIWQHVHYIVGLQRLGHEVYYIEDSTAHPYHPITYDYVPDWSYTAAIMPKLARQFGFEDRW